MRPTITVRLCGASDVGVLGDELERLLESVLGKAHVAGVQIRMHLDRGVSFILGKNAESSVSQYAEVIYMSAAAYLNGVLTEGVEDSPIVGPYEELAHEIASLLCDQLGIEVHKVPRHEAEVLLPEEGETDR